jgi:cytochrome b561
MILKVLFSAIILIVGILSCVMIDLLLTGIVESKAIGKEQPIFGINSSLSKILMLFFIMFALPIMSYLLMEIPGILIMLISIMISAAYLGEKISDNYL